MNDSRLLRRVQSKITASLPLVAAASIAAFVFCVTTLGAQRPGTARPTVSIGGESDIGVILESPIAARFVGPSLVVIVEERSAPDSSRRVLCGRRRPREGGGQLAGPNRSAAEFHRAADKDAFDRLLQIP